MLDSNTFARCRAPPEQTLITRSYRGSIRSIIAAPCDDNYSCPFQKHRRTAAKLGTCGREGPALPPKSEECTMTSWFLPPMWFRCSSLLWGVCALSRKYVTYANYAVLRLLSLTFCVQ